MVELSYALDKTEIAHAYSAQKETLRQCIETEGWDGDWYLRGRFDDGSPLGSSESDEAKIDSLPQSWAWLSGVADPKRAEIALESAWQRLVLQQENIVLLFEPPFDHSVHSPGCILPESAKMADSTPMPPSGLQWLWLAKGMVTGRCSC